MLKPRRKHDLSILVTVQYQTICKDLLKDRRALWVSHFGTIRSKGSVLAGSVDKSAQFIESQSNGCSYEAFGRCSFDVFNASEVKLSRQ